MTGQVAMVNGEKKVELTNEGGSWRLCWERRGKSHSQLFNREAGEQWFNQLVELLRAPGKRVEIREIKL